MKKFLSLLVAIITLFTMMACNPTKKQDASKNESEKSGKVLVLYYSQTGVTKKVAEELSKRLGTDLDSVVPVNGYNGTYDETIERGLEELQTGNFPEIKPLNVNPGDYDVIFLGYPIWFNTYANPIATLLKNVDLSGKKIVPFATFGSGGLEPSVKNIALLQPNADLSEGYGVREIRIDAMPKEIDRFLKENHFIEGQVAPLPDFSDQQPVTTEETKIFDEACGDYQFPLGTPVTAGQRKVEDVIEYKYIVDCKDRDGNPAKSTIYVLVSPDSKPVFTRVVR